MARRVVTGVAAAVAAFALLATAAQADRDFTLRFSTNDTGDIAIVGNTLMTCPDSASTCAAARNGTASGSANNNNGYVMQYVDVDGDPATTFNSSSATLTLPPGSTVLFAGLYWGGRTNAGTNGAPAPNPGARGTVDFRVPGGSYAAVPADNLDDSVRLPGVYGAFADVTTEVATAGSGTYSVGDVQTATGLDRHGGWALAVAYRDTAQPVRNLSVFDGFQTLSQGETPLSMPLTGFRTPSTPPVHSTLGAIVYEGDRGAVGDQATLDNQPISDPLTPATNFFNSTISNRGSLFTAKNPNFNNQLGFDAKLVTADGLIPPGATSATIRSFTTSEQFYPTAFTLATDLFAPRIEATKSVQDLNGGNVVRGDTLRYSVTFSNAGQDAAIEFASTDRIPAGTTFVPGSLTIDGGGQTDAPGDDEAEHDAANDRVVFRLGTGANASQGGRLDPGAGATFTFDVTVDGDVPPGTQLHNQATADFFGEDSGNPFTSETNETSTTVTVPDLTLSKTHTGSFVAGAATPFTITAQNIGTAPTSGAVTVTDAFPATTLSSIDTPTGAGWDCSASTGLTLSCTRSDPLAPGASYPPITVNGTIVAAPPATDAFNTAEIAGGGDDTPANNFSTDVGLVTLRSDLQITKTASAATVYSGERITFDLVVRNAGPSAAQGVVVDDPLIPSIYDDVVATSTQGTCTVDVACTIGDMAPNATVTITIVATVVASDTTVTNTATVDFLSPEDPTPGNNVATASFDVPPSADLAIDKSLAPANPTAGQVDDATYTLTVTNDGPDDATGVAVTDPLPATFTPSMITAPGFMCDSPGTGGTLHCTGGAIASGGSATITIVGTFDASAEGQTIENASRVTADQADGDPEDNHDTIGALIIPAADLELTKIGPATGSEDGEGPALLPGGTATFQLRLTNHGPSDATGVTVADTLPAGLEFVSAAGSCTQAGATVTCAVGTLASGASLDFSITVRAAADTAGRTLENVASATADQPDPVPSNNEGAADLTVGQPPPSPAPPLAPVAPSGSDLAISKIAGVARLGRVLEYGITVSNAGPATATGVQVTDAITGRADVLSIRTSDGTCTRKPAISCRLHDIAPGGRAAILLRVRPMRTGNLTNVATVASTSTDPNAANNRAQVRERVRAGNTRVTVSKTASRASVRGGQRFTYRIVVRSRGPATAVDLRVCDKPPSELVLVGASGARVRNGRACWTVPRLDEGERRTFEVSVRAGVFATAQRVTNTARVKGDNANAVAAHETVRIGPGATACPASVKAYAAC